MARFVIQSLKTSAEDSVHLPEDLNILTALDGQEALRFLQALPVGVVLLDLDLTDMNGLTLLNTIRNDPALHNIPVVIVSASDPPPSFDTRDEGDFHIHMTSLGQYLVDNDAATFQASLVSLCSTDGPCTK